MWKLAHVCNLLTIVRLAPTNVLPLILLHHVVARYTGDSSRFTQLVWPLRGEDPDDAFSRVPYEKGFNFLYHLEGLVGTEQFEAFAKEYLQQFKYATVSSGDFKDFFLSKFSAVPAIAALDWDSFLFGKGMPPNKVDYSNPLMDVAQALAKKWIATNNKGAGPSGVGSKDLDGWDSQQTCVFLGELLEHAKASEPFSLQTLRALDKAYDFTSVVNSEIKFCWQMLCLLSEDKDIVPHVVSFVTSQGRMKFVRPLYHALHKSAVGSAIARETFVENSEMYHPICRKMLATDLGLDLASGAPRTAPAPVPAAAAVSAPAPAARASAAPPDTGDNSHETRDYLPVLAVLVASAAVLAYFVTKNKR